jgi:DNA mismatch repair protein MutS2
MYNTASLEYGKVLEILAGYCVSEYSAEKVRALAPGTDGKFVEEQFDELRELLLLVDREAHPDLSQVYDTTGYLHKAGIKNSALGLQEIACIRENIHAFFRLKGGWARHFADVPRLARKIGAVRVPLRLKERIDRIVDEHGNMRENASPELAEITNRMREIRRHIEATLEGYFNSPETKQFIQEKSITFKDDRYVIPVKQNFKGRIPGVIHAYSGSGQTLFVEPFSITETNNELKLLQKEREKEIERILIALTAEIGACVPELNRLQEALADVDVLLAKRRLVEERGCTIPEVSDAREVRMGEARHPLIQGNVVPIDFVVDAESRGVVITGPNTGGKTVSLKTVGLLVLMAQSGIPVPARYLKTYLFDSVYADIGDEQSIEQSLSTFSGHIKNIKRIVEEATEKSLVLIDELGAGTDPIEGGAIGTAILDYLNRHNILTVVTTHFSTVKVYALSAEGIRVASVQFDPVSCRPTYKLVMGIPGRSNALEIAENLGLKKEILARTLDYMGERERSMDTVMKNLGILEERLARREEQVSREETRHRALVKEYSEKVKAAGEREAYLRTGYKRDLARMLSDYRKRLEGAIGELRRSGASKESIAAGKEELGKIDREFEEHERSRASIEQGAVGDLAERVSEGGAEREDGGAESAGVRSEDELRRGDHVTFLSDFGERIKGVVEETKGDTVSVRAGVLKLSVERKKITLVKARARDARGSWEYEPMVRDATEGRASESRGAEGRSAFGSRVDHPAGRREISGECDLRGMRYEEAMNELVRYLDGAMLSNLETVSIIHGLGTGALRKGVWDTLGRLKYIDHFSYALPEMGGYGCTVVKLKK